MALDNTSQIIAMALSYHKAGRIAEAEAMYRQVLAKQPASAEVLHLLGMVLHQRGDSAAAAEHIRRAIAIDSSRAAYHNNLGLILQAVGRPAEAVEALTISLRLAPQDADTQNNLGNALIDVKRFVDGVQAFRKATQLAPDWAELHHNLGAALYKCAKIEPAIDSFQRAVDLKTSLWGSHSNALLALNCHPQADRGLISEHREWARRHADPLKPSGIDFPNSRESDRRLHVGFVSADFRSHAVMSFFEPVLTCYDRERWEIYLYSNVVRPDATTQRIAGLADQWRDISSLDDEQACAMIRGDRIDILVDLSGHTARHRLLVFARRPAPVQITYLGYPNTTGMTAIDFRICDSVTDPPGESDRHCTEKLIRLPGCFLCYAPPGEAPEIAEPTQRMPQRPVTFGSFNTYAKVSQPTLNLWAQVLSAVPRSRMLLKAESLIDPLLQQAVRAEFATRGVEPHRIDFMGWAPSLREHLALYDRIDIALDTFPYHGTTTTCEALWMGVPVITLTGSAHVSRVGRSLLKAAQLDDLIADSDEAFVATARQLAQSNDRRAAVSGPALRLRIDASPLVDANAFVRQFQSSIHTAWAEGRAT